MLPPEQKCYTCPPHVDSTFSPPPPLHLIHSHIYPSPPPSSNSPSPDLFRHRILSFPSRSLARNPPNPSVVWFRPGDLRTRDHGGLAAATPSALPVFILTPTPPAGVCRWRLPSPACVLTPFRARLFLRHTEAGGHSLRAFLAEIDEEARVRVHFHRHLVTRALADADVLSGDGDFVIGEGRCAVWRRVSAAVYPASTRSFRRCPGGRKEVLG